MSLVKSLLVAGIAGAALLALVVTIIASSAARQHRVQGIHGQTIELTPAEARGRTQFAASCSNCHTLRAVNAVSQVGPDLDFLRPPAAVVRRMIDQGSQTTVAVMPPDLITGSDAAAVSDFVARVAGR